jgi:uncharacterized protein (DUF58 family)
VISLPFRSRRDTRSWLEEEDLRRAAREDEDEALRILRGVRRVEIRSRRLVQNLFSGEYHSVFKGQGIEFSEVREYVPGDDVRLIDRNVSARMQHPYVKIYAEERELTVVFLVDQSGSTRFGSAGKTRAEVTAELVAVLAFSAISNHDKVGCLLFARKAEKWVPPRKGRKHALRVVREVLYGRPEEAGTSIAEALQTVSRVLKRRSVIFILSDFLDHGYDSALAVVGRRHEVVPLVLVDPAERSLPSVGLIEADDLETGERRLIDTSDPAVRAAQAARWKELSERDLDERFRYAGVTPVFLPLDGDYIEPLFRYFQRRARRKAAGG